MTNRPLSAVPNAGLPREVEGRKMYMASPDYLAKYTRRLVQSGVRFVGGCCGTTPEHIHAMADQVRAFAPRQRAVVVGAVPTAKSESTEPAVEPVPTAERSQLARKIVAGQLVTSVEIMPPKVGYGGGTPRPRKLSPDSASMKDPSFKEVLTMIRGRQLGKIWVKMILRGELPKLRAAMIKS